MADRDPIDRNFLIFCVVGLLCIGALALKIFPHHDAPTASPSATAPAKK